MLLFDILLLFTVYSTAVEDVLAVYHVHLSVLLLCTVLSNRLGVSFVTVVNYNDVVDKNYF